MFELNFELMALKDLIMTEGKQIIYAEEIPAEQINVGLMKELCDSDPYRCQK